MGSVSDAWLHCTFPCRTHTFPAHVGRHTQCDGLWRYFHDCGQIWPDGDLGPFVGKLEFRGLKVGNFTNEGLIQAVDIQSPHPVIVE